MSPEHAAIVCDGLTKRFLPPAGVRRLLMKSPLAQPITAVEDVTVRVEPGEVFGLLGPNGAGKSTLIRLLTTLLRPTSGSASVAGFDVVDNECQVRRAIGVSSGDERSFHWRLTARQNLEFFASLAGVPATIRAERIGELLEWAELDSSAENMYYSFSSGMRQKLSITRALLARPSVLFLDEPTKNVDVVAAADLNTLIREKLTTDGRTVVLATHRMNEAEQLCDRIGIMLKGRMVFCGTVSELRKLTGCTQECTLTVDGLDRTQYRTLAARHNMTYPEQAAFGSGVEFRFALARPSKLNEVLRDVLGLGGTVISCDRHERALEDIFVDMVRGVAHAG